MALPTSEVKFDMNLISRIPILTGQDNYDMWRLRIQTTLSAYSMWEFVDGTLTYAAQADAADQLKWKLLDKQVLGLMASTINDSLLTHVNYEWMDPVVCPSISKALWNILKGLFGTVGIPGQFNLFYQALRLRIDPKNTNYSINEYYVHFQKLVEAGYNLPETLCTMILLSGLLTNYFPLTSTIMQTVEPANFNMSTVSKWILMDMDLCATHKPLHAQISQAESGGQSSSSSSINRTNVIKRGPPLQNQWRSQTPSYQPRSFGNQPSGSYSNQPQSGSANPNQRKNGGPAKSKWPGKCYRITCRLQGYLGGYHFSSLLDTKEPPSLHPSRPHYLDTLWSTAYSLATSNFLRFTRCDTFLFLLVFLLSSFILSSTSFSSAIRLVGSALLLRMASLLPCVIGPIGPLTIPVPDHVCFSSLLRIAALTADAILRLALVFSSLPLFHYGLHCGVLTTLYIQRLSL